jgi:hypothetical protein
MMSSPGKWMGLEINALSKTIQSQKTTITYLLSYEKKSRFKKGMKVKWGNKGDQQEGKGKQKGAMGVSVNTLYTFMKIS